MKAAVLDLLDALADWETFYGAIDGNGEETWMTQLSHGHEEYEVRMKVMEKARVVLDLDTIEGEDTPR